MKYILVIIISLLLFGCSKDENKEESETNLIVKPVAYKKTELKQISKPVFFEEHIPIKQGAELFKKLEKCYQNKDSVGFNDFFRVWNKIITSNPDSIINQNDTINELYEIFRAFYNAYTPIDPKYLEKWYMPKKELKYYVIQNQLKYKVIYNDTFKLKYNSKEDTINNFKPIVNYDKEKVLYLTPEYPDVLIAFLSKNFQDNSNSRIDSLRITYDEFRQRHDYLMGYINIYHGHFMKYFEFETHPYVSRILIDKSLERARLSFCYGHQFFDVLFLKVNGKWKNVKFIIKGIS
jgi:hypothetical protein